MTDTITMREAAKLLGIQSSTIYELIKNRKLEKYGPSLLTKESVLDYLKRRGPKKRPLAGIYAKQGQKMEARVLFFIWKHFEEHGSSPGYGWLSEHAGVSKSGISRYIEKLSNKGKVEIYEGCIFLPGLREEIRKIVRKEFQMKAVP